MSTDTSAQTTRETGRFAGKNILITGVSGGIGRATAERIVAEGGSVLITGTNVEKLDLVKAELPDAVTLVNDAGDSAAGRSTARITRESRAPFLSRADLPTRRRAGDGWEAFRAAATLPSPATWPASHRRQFLGLVQLERFQLAQQMEDTGLEPVTFWLSYASANDFGCRVP